MYCSAGFHMVNRFIISTENLGKQVKKIYVWEQYRRWWCFILFYLSLIIQIKSIMIL
jgi:hypothetical protein